MTPPPGLFTRAMQRSTASFGTRETAQVLPATRLGGPMPWIIAIMVALTVLAAGGALALSNFATQTQAGLEGGLTIQIVAENSAAQVRNAEAFLASEHGVAKVRVV